MSADSGLAGSTFTAERFLVAGIVGFIGQGSSAENGAMLEAMVRRVTHEGFERSGNYNNEPLKLWAGWVCQESTFADCQPVWNEKRDVCLIFSGEDFRDRAEIDALRARGHAFDPENASYLVHLYEE